MASSSHKIGPTGIGIALVGAVVIVILLAMFVGGDTGGSYRTAEKRDKSDYSEQMESRGKWLGMYLSETSSKDARALRVPPHVKGVVVTGLKEPNAARARAGGIQVGDVITAIDGKKIRRLGDVKRISKKTDVVRPVMLDVLAGGQPMTKVLPGATVQPVATPVAWQPARQVQWPPGWYGGAVGSYWGVTAAAPQGYAPVAFAPGAVAQPYLPTPAPRQYVPIAAPRQYVPVAAPRQYAPVAVPQTQPYLYAPAAAAQAYPRYVPTTAQPYMQLAPRAMAHGQPRYAVVQPSAFPFRR